MKRYFLLMLCCYLVQEKLVSQPDNTYTAYLKAQAHYGYIMQHRNSMGHLIKGHITGVELNYALPTKGDKLWHYENNFPESGVALHVYFLANPDQLGRIYALAPYYDVGLKARNTPSRLYMRVSTGIAYADKKFDPATNYKNNVISTTINAFVNFKWYYKFELSKKLRIDAGLNFSHASNGRFKTPNLGMNVLTLNAGLTYKMGQSEPKTIDKIDSSSKAKSRHELYGVAALGINEVGPPGGSKYFSQSYILGYYYNKRNTHKFGLGMDVFFCQSVLEEIYVSTGTRVTNEADYIQIGARASYAYNIGKFGFPVEFGYYVRNAYKDDGLFYHRIGVKYYCNNNIIVNFSLKTHWAVAQYFEYGVGYRLPLKKKKTIN